MVPHKLFVAALLLASLSSAALAQDDSRTQGDRACRGDASRHCHKYLDQGDGPILQCLRKHAKQLSRGCRKVLEDAGQL